uniref:ShKT domain-containing protein n=1 Tax=Ditylenchus dipsaci TaxID=166011 RepID=A0A915EBD2_9BILA
MTSVIVSLQEALAEDPIVPSANGDIGDGLEDNGSKGPSIPEDEGSSSASDKKNDESSSSTESSRDSKKLTSSEKEEEEKEGGSRDRSDEESDEEDDGDDTLPQPDNNTGQNEGNTFIADANGILPGNWGANCPQLAQQNLCNNDLYRTVMQRSCRTSCGSQNCLDRRPDLVVHK